MLPKFKIYYHIQFGIFLIFATIKVVGEPKQQNLISAKKFSKRTGCLQPSNSLVLCMLVCPKGQWTSLNWFSKAKLKAYCSNLCILHKDLHRQEPKHDTLRTLQWAVFWRIACQKPFLPCIPGLKWVLLAHFMIRLGQVSRYCPWKARLFSYVKNYESSWNTMKL